MQNRQADGPTVIEQFLQADPRCATVQNALPNLAGIGRKRLGFSRHRRCRELRRSRCHDSRQGQLIFGNAGALLEFTDAELPQFQWRFFVLQRGKVQAQVPGEKHQTLGVAGGVVGDFIVPPVRKCCARDERSRQSDLPQAAVKVFDRIWQEGGSETVKRCRA